MMNRNQILTAIVAEQQKVIDNLKYTVNRYVSASDLEEDTTIETDDLSQQVQAKDMQLRFEQLLKIAEEEMDFLLREKGNSHRSVERGSLIDLDSQIVFIGISVPKIEVENRLVLSFSQEAPAYKNFESKIVGDTVHIGTDNFIIKEIC